MPVSLCIIIFFFFSSCPSRQFWSWLWSGWLHGSCVQSWPGYPGDLHLNLHALSWFSGLSWTCLYFDQQAVSNPGRCIQVQRNPTTDLLICCWPDLLAGPWAFHVTEGFSGSLDPLLSEGVSKKHAPPARFRCLPFLPKTYDTVFFLLLGLKPHLWADSKKQDEVLMVMLGNVHNKASWHYKKTKSGERYFCIKNSGLEIPIFRWAWTPF